MKKVYLILCLIILTNSLFSQNNSQFISQVVPSPVNYTEVFSVSITFKNTGTSTWKSSDKYSLGSQNPQDNIIWGINRVALPNDVAPGNEVTFTTDLTAPEYGNALQWRMVQDGVEWFGEYSDIYPIAIITDPSLDSLLTGNPSFSGSSHIVSTSMFHWYSSNGGQLSGPWIPLEGRENWTGDAEFWKGMIKQTMAANIDVYYVLLIPSMEQERINLFQALYELRKEGWDVPKVCPFFDPIITCDLTGHNIDVGTEEGIDELVSHYRRFYYQYYSRNRDEYADDYIYTIDGKVVLDTWHVHLNIINYSQLSRNDIESRLIDSFGTEHPVFNNGIRMITTAISPTYTFADEKVHQFEVHEYYIEENYNYLVSAQIKPGYWDQNVRNPGYIMQRNGGSKYTSAWNNLNSYVNRVYIESFNEYDEGSGIYAAKTDTIYKTNENTATDTWSATNDPYEYIKTTAIGAAAFNDNDELDSKIIWNNIPDAIIPGDTFNATIVVRNSGNIQWNAANEFKFGQQEGEDLVLFGPNRYLIDDTQNDIPVYGGIFRGRTIIFNLQITAPDTIGTFVTRWGMLQGSNTWFGEILEKSITVSLTADIKQQNIEKEFNIYPIPVSLSGLIQIDGDFKKNDRIVIRSINGTKVFEEKIPCNKKNLDISPQTYNMIEGIHIIQIISDNKVYTKKILINN